MMSPSKYGPSYGTPSYADRKRRSSSASAAVAESTPLSPSSTAPVWSNVDLRQPQHQYSSELPRRRRIRRDGKESLAKWTTRMVVASPLLVLFLWSLALVFHAGKSVESRSALVVQSKMGAVRVPVRPKKKNKTAKLIPNKPRAAAQVVVQPRAAATTVVSDAQQKYIPVATPVETIANHEAIPIVAPLGQQVTTGKDAKVVSRPRPKPRASQFNTNQAMMSTEQQPALTSSSQFTGSNAMTTTVNTESSQAVQDDNAMTTQETENAMGSTLQTGTNLLTRRAPTIYYYDVATSTKNGQLHVPEIVYDADGTALELASLNDGRTEIYLEPPSLTRQDAAALGATQQQDSAALGSTQDSVALGDTQQQDSAALGATQQQEAVALGSTQQLQAAALGATQLQDSAALGSTQQQEAAVMGSAQQQQQEASMQLGENLAKNLPQQQDQWIIIATVATMALLVGALSARRMRSRQFLSGCIENESLEDELAYDTAYTASAAGSYDTFAHYKGDLEKFDV